MQYLFVHSAPAGPPPFLLAVLSNRERSPSARHFRSQAQEKKSPGRSKKMCLGNREEILSVFELLENDHGSLLLGKLIMVLLLDNSGPWPQIASTGKGDAGLGGIGKRGRRCFKKCITGSEGHGGHDAAPIHSQRWVFFFANKLTFKTKDT